METDQSPSGSHASENLKTSQQEPKILGVTETLDKDEHIIAVIHRHIAGLLIIYLVAIAAVIGFLVVATMTFSTIFGTLSGRDNLIFTAIIILGLGLFFFVLAIITYIYYQNKIVVTNKNLLQVLQSGLFGRKISRLSLADVEDVTADQRGILSHLFNYGILNVETAGEMKNFIFPYAPDPNKYADIVLDERLKYNDAHYH